MKNDHHITEHYHHGGLLEAITLGCALLGKSADNLSIADLAPVDEFHIGGRSASEHFLDQLKLCDQQHILDIGCGLGGTARLIASRYQSRVTGIDLSAEYVETGKTLCRWLKLEALIDLHQGSALSMDFADRSFDGAYMMHVGMNIGHKSQLFKEIARMLCSGALFGIYDVMRMGNGNLVYPVPWATTQKTSAVARPSDYKEGLQNAGFNIEAEYNRRDFALDFFAQLSAKTAELSAPAPLGLHILMGESAPTKIGNMVQNIRAGRIAPVELIARKR